MKQEKQKRKGFTLLELLIVILIIGVLAAIALPQYQYSVDKTKFIQLKIAAKTIKDAQLRYMLVNDERSLDLSALDIDIEFNCHLAGSTKSTVWCELPNFIVYTNLINSNTKKCAAYESAGKRALRLCQNEFPNSHGEYKTDYCGGGPCTVYTGY